MGSDIMIILKGPVDEAGAEAVRAAIHGATTTATVSFDASRPRLFLVRFDPEQDSPPAMLAAVRGSGLDATMAGG
jgi:hypothetical protein